MLRRQSARAARAAVLSVSLALVPAANAITHTWNGGNSFGPTSMSNALNWSGGLPSSGNTNLTLVFPGSASVFNPNQNIANPLVVESLQFTSGGFYTLSGNQVQLKNLGSAPAISATNATASIPNAINFFNATTVTTDATSNIQLNGALTGSTVTFSNSTTTNNSISIGGTGSNTVSAVVTPYASLTLNKSDAVAGSVSLNGGTLTTNVSGAFNPATNLTVNSPTVAVPLSNFNYTNPAIRFQGSQQVNNLVLNGGQIDNQSGVFTIAGGITATGNSVIVAVGGGVSFNGTLGKSINTPAAADTLTIDTAVSTGSFNKIGAGTLVLTNTFIGGASTFGGQNVISAGKVVSATEAALGTNTLNNATLEIIGGNYTGLISGAGNVVINGFAQYSALNSYSGGTSLTSSSQLFAEPQYLHGSITGGSNSLLQLTTPTNQTLNATLSGAVDITALSGTGVITFANTSTTTGTVTFNSSNGGMKLLANNALGVGSLAISAPSAPISIEAVGNISLANAVQPFTGITFVGGGNLNFTNTAAKSSNWGIVHNSTGNTTMAGKFSLGAPASIVVNNGSLTLGDQSAVGGFLAQGPITVNSGGVLVLKSLNFISLPDVTLNGGTLKTPNGYAIPLGAALQGNGTVDGRVSSANGSSIIANGNLFLGDLAHPAGVNLDGELYTGKFTVTLNDSNQSVLGSLTNLGNGPGTPGTLVSMSGAVVNFGRNITGNGLIKSTNALAQAVIMNGDVNGLSPTDYVEFSGYVKGVGTFNNVAFSGTFSPGLSPALLTVGNVLFTSSNVLDIEIGGLNRGSQYDALDITGSLLLNGQLKVTLINSFNPSLGDIFNVFDGPMTGTFSSFNFPALSPGLTWDTSQLYTQGWLQIAAVPEPTTLAGMVALGVATLRRKRR
jgi:hypothetical protein